MNSYLIRPTSTGFKFDLKAANGQVIATSEVYRNVTACRKGIESVRVCAPAAPVEDRTEPDPKTLPHPKFELFADRSGQYRFRLKARNGKIIAVSEGYATHAGCEKGIESVRAQAADATVEELQV